MDYDNYGEVINGGGTYDRIADTLNAGNNIIIGWTDGHMSHFDILFTCSPHHTYAFGNLQGGVKESDLFISIMRVGSFGFETNHLNVDAGYYTEKLSRAGNIFGMNGSLALAELINQVKKRLK